MQVAGRWPSSFPQHVHVSFEPMQVMLVLFGSEGGEVTERIRALMLLKGHVGDPSRQVQNCLQLRNWVQKKENYRPFHAGRTLHES